MNQGPTRLCVPLFLILLRSSWAYLKTPENATVCLGSVTNISCASANVQTIFYMVNGTAVPSSILQGFSVSAQIPIGGNVTEVMLTVQAIYIGVSQIRCSILLINETLANSFFSYFTVQGPPSAPSNFMAVATSTAFELSWGVPPGAQLLSLLYTVVVKTGNGTILFNRTVEELQVIINISNACDQYEATVMANCGATSGYSSMRNFSAGPPSAPSNLMAVSTDTALNISWEVPLGAQLSSLMYTVVVKTGNGTILFNDTVEELQVIINIPNACDQYEATVMANCGATRGYPSMRNFSAGACNSSSTVLPNATMTSVIGGIAAGGVLIIIIIIAIVVIVACCCQRKKSSTYDTVDHSMNESVIELKPISRFELEYKDCIVIDSGKSGVVVTAKDKADHICAIKVSKSDQNCNIEAIVHALKKMKLSGCVRHDATWLEEPPPDWKRRKLLPWTTLQIKFCHVEMGHQYRFIQTEYCDEGNLEDWLRGHPEQVDVCDIFNQLLDAVSEMHSNGIYHGDLVIQNVFVAMDGSKPQLKIGDFTKAVLCNRTDSKETDMKDKTHSQDLFQLGVILMQLIYFKEKKEIVSSLNIEQLFGYNKHNETVRKVIELLCGKEASGKNGDIDLDAFKGSEDFGNWMCKHKSACYSAVSPNAQTTAMPISPEAVSRLEREYKDISFIGSGKNGVVIKGIYRADGREYAIKVCKKNSNDNEIKALTDNKLKKSNHCVRYYDTWTDYPEPDWEKRNLLPWTAFKYNPLCPQVDKTHEYRFIKTEYCAGGNLCIWLQKYKKDANVYYIFNQILDAVADIHNNNFYHGDLVLQNIFVANDESNPQLKIGDFTDAVFCEAGMTERVRRRDVFRLGGILMQLIYFEQNHEILPITDIEKLFTLMPNEAVRKVIELLCGKDASGDNGNTYLDEFKRSDEYVNWRKLDHMQQEYI